MKNLLQNYYDKHTQQKEALTLLRELVSKCGLEETLKWGAPMFTHSGHNVVGLAAFKAYTGLWFPKGALMTDPLQILINAQEGKTKMNRQWRFQTVDEIKSQSDWIVRYCKEAKKLSTQKQEKKALPKTLPVSQEWENAVKNNPALQKAFSGFSVFKQNEFLEYISEAKKPETRINRLKKCIDLVQQGFGLNDKYRT